MVVARVALYALALIAHACVQVDASMPSRLLVVGGDPGANVDGVKLAPD